MESINREIKKACVAFQKVQTMSVKDEMTLSTGKWGCGAFNGNVQLKFLIQWLAASYNGKAMIFNTFHDISGLQQIKEVHELLRS